MGCAYLSLGGDCLLRGTQNVDCSGCSDLLQLTDKDFHSKWQDPLVILDRHRNQTSSLRHLLVGGSAFLLLGGPSSNALPLELLARRGVWSLAVNNMAGHPRVRPQAFICADPPSKFSHSIWLDPGIMKFVPTPKLSGYRSYLRKKVNGSFSDLGKSVLQCPNVWAFQRWSWLWPDERFFLTDGACWGNQDKCLAMTKQPKTVSTMLLGIRMLYYLGARRIYLVGADFNMSPTNGYSFGQGRDAGASASNNHLFEVVNHWLCTMSSNKTFDKMGVKIFNCYERSGLRAFGFAPFEAAIEEAVGSVEACPDLSEWYEK